MIQGAKTGAEAEVAGESVTPPQLRVLHVIPGIGAGGGAERSLAGTAARLTADGIELHVATFTDRLALVGDLEAAGVRWHDLRPAAVLAERVRAVRRLVRDLDPDLVHSSLFDADLPTQLAVGRSRPVLVTWTGTPFEMASRYRGLRRVKVEAVRWAQVACARWSASHFQAVTGGIADVNSAALHVPRARVHIARRGRPEHETASRETLDALRSELGIGAARVVLMIARHEPEKDLETALATVEQLRTSTLDVVFIVAGREGVSTPQLVAMVDQLNLSERVRLLGARDDVPALLDLADVVLSTSVSEGAAGGLVEAMAAEKAIVSSDAAGSLELIDDGVTGTVVRRGDVTGFADAIIGYLNQPELARRHGESAALRFSARYSDECSAVALVDLYRSLIASDRRSAA